jgi:hypothetical protein
LRVRWRSGFVAYWVRGVSYVAAGGAVGLAAALLIVRSGGGYGVSRHLLSKIAAVCVAPVLLFALRRRRILRFGWQATWLKAHWVLAGAGLALLFSHSALRPGTWSGWITFGLAASAMASGAVTHFTRRYARYYALRAHLVAVLALVGSALVHGAVKLHHPDFPLVASETPRGTHDVPCAVCHERRNRYRDYTCTACHAHASETLRELHQLHGVPDYERCLDCHRATLSGSTFFTGEGRFVPGDVFRSAP